MQLLLSESHENGLHNGIGLIDGVVEKITVIDGKEGFQTSVGIQSTIIHSVKSLINFSMAKMLENSITSFTLIMLSRDIMSMFLPVLIMEAISLRL